MKTKIILGLLAATCGVVAMPAAAVTYTYVGSWAPDQGPVWFNNPLAYSGVGAAAMLFGGSASQYAISTVDANPAHIDFQANYEIIGVGSSVFNDHFFRGVEGTTHYEDVFTHDPSTDTVSTYVSDFGNSNINYAFAINSVPEPATWTMLVAGFGLVGTAVRRRKVVVTA
jgi:hypothetical protein